MSTPEQARLDHYATQHPAGPSPSEAAYADQQARLAADIAAMQAGPTEHAAEMTSHHQGQPSVEVQQKTHGQPAPKLPDVGGHG